MSKNLFDPPLISTRTTESIIRNKTLGAKSFDIGIHGLSDKYVMARSNKINGIVADTSQGKTTVSNIIAGNLAKQLDVDNNEIGLIVTWEDTIEDFGLSDFANISKIPISSLYSGKVSDQEFKKVLRASSERAQTPLWIMGQSEESTHLEEQFTMTDVCEAVDYLINKQGKKIKFVMLDYLQAINRADINERDARMQFAGVMNKVKEFTMSFHPCTWIGSQVSRSKVEKVKWRQPQIHWAMETANFEHRCDGAISLWMPSKSLDVWQDGECLAEKKNPQDKAIFVRPETMIIEIIKQKKAPTGHVQALDFLPEYNMLVEYGTADVVRNQIKKEVSHV